MYSREGSETPVIFSAMFTVSSCLAFSVRNFAVPKPRSNTVKMVMMVCLYNMTRTEVRRVALLLRAGQQVEQCI